MFWDLPRRMFFHFCYDGLEVIGGGPAAASDYVDYAFFGKIPQDRGHKFPGMIVFTELIGESGVGVCVHMALGNARHLFNVLA